jgi:isoleucyl-tRNA synthetase
VDLSALYFDVVKDRLYTNARDSRARRSAQATMHEILLTLVRVIAPILCFTADEIWRAMPEGQRRAAGGRPSVFLTDFPVADPAWKDDALLARWERLWEIRGAVTKALEEQRREGRLGQSLEARVTLAATGRDAEILAGIGERGLCEVFIVSQVQLAAGSGELSVTVEAARGSKCGRCWNFSEAVGTFADHAELCDRCHEVVAAL